MVVSGILRKKFATTPLSFRSSLLTKHLPLDRLDPRGKSDLASGKD